jgi:glyoxylase-like metal-dependent hydrolase (beta-lactamase superfamily II)
VSCVLIVGSACASDVPAPAASEYWRFPAPSTPSKLQVAIIKTGEQSSREGLVVSGGSLFEPVTMSYVAVLVKHPDGKLLFDAGLGRQVDAQYQASMPSWAKPFLSYRNPKPVADWLDGSDDAVVNTVVLSHPHWDHASGIADFPNANVYMPAADAQFAKDGKPPAVLPNQFAHAGYNALLLTFREQRFGLFQQSLDWFGDGSVVFVPLPGHTPASTGMIVTLISGQRYFFVGDAIWNSKALDDGAAKPWFARGFADYDSAQTLASIRRIRQAQASNPGLIVVPAHDNKLHNQLGYYPSWLK